MNAVEEYKKWCRNPYFDVETRDELLKINTKEEIQDRFGKELEFGTGGLRGIMGVGLNRMNRYTVRKATQGLSEVIKKQNGGKRGVAIAYDTRHCSQEFAQEAAACLCGNGIRVFLFDEIRPTPQLSFAVRTLGCIAGIMITASHNPSVYNGYKVYWEDGAQITYPLDKEIMDSVKQVVSFQDTKRMDLEQAAEAGLLKSIGGEMDTKYIESLKTLVEEPEIVRQMAGQLKIVYTPLHGSADALVRRILKELGFCQVYVVEEQAVPSGDFPTVPSPNPEEKTAFTMALSLAKEVDADIVLGTDPDGDRLGIYVKDTKTGSYIGFTGNMSGMILCEYLLERKREKQKLASGGAVVTTIVSGKMAAAAAKAYGVAYMETLTGFKYIGEQIKKFEESGTYEYLFGFEESYGCLVGTNSRDKDGVGAVMSICEAAAFYKAKEMTLWDQMNILYGKYGFYKEHLHTIEKTGPDGLAWMKQWMEELRGEPFRQIGGRQVIEFRDYNTGLSRNLQSGQVTPLTLPKSNVLYFELEHGGWVCIRPSGTEPKVKIYMGVCSETPEKAETYLECIWKQLEMTSL